MGERETRHALSLLLYNSHFKPVKFKHFFKIALLLLIVLPRVSFAQDGYYWLRTTYVVFDGNATQLNNSGKQILDRLVLLMQSYPSFRVVIEGRDRKLKREQQQNRKRIDTALDYLTQIGGLDRPRFLVKYTGDALAGQILIRAPYDWEKW